MLRALVLILFLANLLFYLWTQGVLDSVVGPLPNGQREPDRMARQVHPEVIRVLSAAAQGGHAHEEATAADGAASSAAPPDAASAAASDVAPGASGAEAVSPSASAASAPEAASSVAQAGAVALACLDIGPYSLAERIQVERKLKTVLKPGDWMDRTHERVGAWMVYMGRYASEDLLRKKEDELRRMKIEATVVRKPAELMWGLSLGQFDNRAEADDALNKIAQRGVRSARVMPARPPETAHTLRVLNANAATQSALAALPAAVWLGHPPRPCGPLQP